MRRKDRGISAEEATWLLAEGEYGVLSTVGEDGQPYGIPLSYAYRNNSIYIHCALEGHKLVNMDYNRKVSFCVVGRTKILPEKFATEYESVIVSGTACAVQGVERIDALVSLLGKYSPAFIEEGKRYIEQKDSVTRVIRIDIDSLTGKARK
jgi:nitroimidazol reductase NimA-like FMN-containing flavoprotein (pyridoxamine 5'-phosphate oxidase superfamily)